MLVVALIDLKRVIGFLGLNSSGVNRTSEGHGLWVSIDRLQLGVSGSGTKVQGLGCRDQGF